MFAASMKCVVSLVMLVCYLLLSFAIPPLFLIHILLLSLVTLPSWMSAYNTWNSRWTLATNRKSPTPINTVSFTECEFYKSTSTVFDKQQFYFAEGNEPNKSEYTVCPDWLVWPDGVSMNLRLWMLISCRGQSLHSIRSFCSPLADNSQWCPAHNPRVICNHHHYNPHKWAYRCDDGFSPTVVLSEISTRVPHHSGIQRVSVGCWKVVILCVDIVRLELEGAKLPLYKWQFNTF